MDVSEPEEVGPELARVLEEQGAFAIAAVGKVYLHDRGIVDQVVEAIPPGSRRQNEAESVDWMVRTKQGHVLMARPLSFTELTQQEYFVFTLFMGQMNHAIMTTANVSAVVGVSGERLALLIQTVLLAQHRAMGGEAP